MKYNKGHLQPANAAPNTNPKPLSQINMLQQLPKESLASTLNSSIEKSGISKNKFSGLNVQSI